MNPVNQNNLLAVEDLHTSFYTKKGQVNAVDGVSFSAQKGEIIGLVGESGSGKSITCLSIMDWSPSRPVKSPPAGSCSIMKTCWTKAKKKCAGFAVIGFR